VRTCCPATLLTTALVLFTGCQSSEQSAAAAPVMAAPAAETPSDANVDPDAITGVVVKTMDSGGYTYVLVDTGSDQVWAAGPAIIVSAGDTVTFNGSMPMNGYHSRTLDMTFECVYFTGAIEIASS